MTGASRAASVGSLDVSSSYLMTRFRGTALHIHEAWMAMFGRWLPDSGCQADDRPCFELYDEGAGVDPKTGAFSCLLCVPLKAL